MAAEGIPGTMGIGRKMAGSMRHVGGLRMMKINRNRNGMMGVGIGTWDETTNNKRKWVWGC